MMDALVIPTKKRKKRWFPVQVEGDDKIYELPPLENVDLDIINQMRALAPRLGDMKTGKPRKNVKQQDVMQAVGILTTVMDRYAPGLAKRLDLEQLNFLFERWSEFSNVTMGESSASPTS